MLEQFTYRRKITELKAKAEDAKRELDRTEKSQAAATEKADNELDCLQEDGRAGKAGAGPSEGAAGEVRRQRAAGRDRDLFQPAVGPRVAHPARARRSISSSRFSRCRI